MTASVLQIASQSSLGGASSYTAGGGGAGNNFVNSVAGSTILAVTFINNGRSVSSESDTQGNTYAAFGTNINADDGSLKMLWSRAYNIAGGAGANTKTWNYDAGTSTMGGLIIEVGGVTTAAAILGSDGAVRTNPGTSTDAVVAPSITPSAFPAIVIAVAVRTDGTTAAAAGTGYTSAGAAAGFYNDYQYRVEWQRVTSGAQIASFTAGGATDDFLVGVVVLQELSGRAMTFGRGGTFGGGITRYGAMRC